MRGILPSICQSHEMTLPAGDQPWGEGGVLLFRSKVLFKAENLPIVPLSRETDLTLIIIIIIIIILKKKKKRCWYSTQGKEGPAVNTRHKPSNARGTEECSDLDGNGPVPDRLRGSGSHVCLRVRSQHCSSVISPHTFGSGEVQNTSPQVAVRRRPGWSGFSAQSKGSCWAMMECGGSGESFIHSPTHAFIRMDWDSAYDLLGAELGTGEAAGSQRPRGSGLLRNGDD